jgi:hypothetical protein
VSGNTLLRVELATKQVSGQAVMLKKHALPLDLAAVDDVDALRRDVQAEQGNNPTRRIKLVVASIAEGSAVKVHRSVARGV